ncbi:transcription antitermination factor NusB [Parasediminibacterium sp. JCM 36343]|uniref:transcription antitermination factor NusB n=1 Tax=Parasediminibacterium sp. JCM 36343 TaxID=3374279 RepID=UPI00397CA205
MISRRNIRVKVMQLLYMMDAGKGDNAIKNPVAELEKSFEKTKELLVYLLYFTTEVARYAETDAVKKANKHLPTLEDLNVNTKLAGNELLWQIVENESFKKAVEKVKPENLINPDFLKRIYNNLVASSEYQLYINAQSREKQKEKEILRFIFTNLMLPDEVFTSHLEELFNNWDDDCEMMDQMVNNYLSKPNGYNLQEIISEEKWAFAKSLLISTYNKRQYLLDLIKPKLQNWDSERIASLDMVLMQMGVCEFLYFETIPTKVTINEYIDLAKEYSTEQSGFFVNGILDNIHKELAQADKLNKIEFKQKK